MAPSASYWMADKGVLAVGADNSGWDVPGLKIPTWDVCYRDT